MGSSFANALKCGKDLNRRNESKGPGWQDTVTQSPEAWTCKMIRELLRLLGPAWPEHRALQQAT